MLSMVHSRLKWMFSGSSDANSRWQIGPKVWRRSRSSGMMNNDVIIVAAKLTDFPHMYSRRTFKRIV